MIFIKKYCIFKLRLALVFIIFYQLTDILEIRNKNEILLYNNII